MSKFDDNPSKYLFYGTGVLGGIAAICFIWGITDLVVGFETCQSSWELWAGRSMCAGTAVEHLVGAASLLLALISFGLLALRSRP